jgi:RNA polymerase I-specific transcription initiation factor RRN3
MFGMDMDAHHLSSSTHYLSPEEELRQREQKENAMKLDCLLDFLFSHIQCRNQTEREEYFKILLRSFDSLVLNTHESKYTQFIYFYLAMLHPQFAASFITYLTSHLNGSLNSNDFVPSNRNRRLSAVAYIASFLGRASFLPAHIIRESIAFLIQFLHEYLDRHEFELARTLNISADAEKHGLFYLVVQAALYAFCFKHRVLIEDNTSTPSENINPKLNAMGGKGLVIEQKHGWLSAWNLERIIESTLNPMIMIQEQVAQEFTNIALNLGHPLGPLCERILQRNKLIVLPTRASFGGENRIETFFPFDPWMLKVSSKHFKDGYQYWESVNSAYDEEDDFESSESVHGTPTPTSGVPIKKRPRLPSNAMQLARSLEDGGFSLGSYSNSYNIDSEMAFSSVGGGATGFGSYESHSMSASPVYFAAGML